MKKPIIVEVKAISYIDDDGLSEEEINKIINDSEIEEDFQRMVVESDGEEVTAKLTLPNGKVIEKTKKKEVTK